MLFHNRLRLRCSLCDVNFITKSAKNNHDIDIHLKDLSGTDSEADTHLTTDDKPYGTDDTADTHATTDDKPYGTDGKADTHATIDESGMLRTHLCEKLTCVSFFLCTKCFLYLFFKFKHGLSELFFMYLFKPLKTSIKNTGDL